MLSRYLPAINGLADRTAKDLHRSFESALLQKFAEKMKGADPDAGAIAGSLARWRRRANHTAIGCAGAGVLSLFFGAASQPGTPSRVGFSSLAVGAIAGAHIQRRSAEEIEPVLGIVARIQAHNSISPLMQIMNQPTTLQAHLVPEATVSGAIALPEAQPRFFNWDELKDPDIYPHCLIIGPTGSGKTFSTERILKFLGSPARVITTKRKSDQWVGLEVIGHPRNFPAISEALEDSLEEMQSRLEAIDKPWEQQWNVIDELPAIVANLPETQDYLTTFIREARETRLRFMFLVQGAQVKTIGLEGQSDLRDNLLEIRLGRFAVDEAGAIARKTKSPEAQANLDWLKSQKYPLLVGDLPALLPEAGNG
ncbi:type IV secretory system conjugative DNA transfer family protein [Laspinema palackyanum]|uniref:type IV secretory system conjugative DNA transfer family protein n=1 Tax=Laspinema palackyanum TaxID=3231601 RepID=UPI00345C91F3|nr:type IV secretory system conjugative DNA transfer family protein [Laspinema sp. D2c]